MSKPTVEELEAADSRLSRAFLLAIAGVVCSVATGLWFQAVEERTAGTWAVYVVGQLFLIVTYVWFATAIGRAATYLVPSPWKYIGWVLIAPFLALIPIPIVSTLIAVSPLSLKFFFTGQLRNEIKTQLLAD